MFKIEIVSIGKSMPAWVNEGYQTYAKRLKPYYDLTLTEYAMAKRTNKSNLTVIKQQESDALLNACQKDYCIIALDEKGKHYTTKELSTELTKWQQNYQGVQFLIGGPDGFNQAVRNRANTLLALSSLTLPHPLVRVMLIEQIYRITSLLHHHPYHRE